MISTNGLTHVKHVKRFLLRIPADLHGRLQSAAKQHGVSLNHYCLQLLRGEGPAGPFDAERRRAHNGSLAADHMARAEARLLALDTLFEAESWADVVRESQEVVELVLRGLMRWAGLDPPPDREAGGALLAGRERFSSALATELPALAETARRLRRDRDLAFHGSPDLIPWEFYRRQDAQAARDAARRTVQTVRAHVLDG